MAERGLGKGLGALLGDAALQSQEGGSVVLPISQIEAGLRQPRKYFDEEALAELSDSIRQHGILQPLTVRRLSSGYYQIIAGERRWRAARMAGLSEVPVMIIEADDRKAMELAMIENLQREDLNPIEEAEGFRSLIETYGMTQEEASSRVGRSRPAVANSLRLLSLPEDIQSLLSMGSITSGHARALLQLKFPDEQRRTVNAIVQNQLSVRQTELLVKRLSEQERRAASQRKPGVSVNYLQEVERNLTELLGRRVTIVNGKKKGKFELEYYGERDFEELLLLLQKIQPSEKRGSAIE
ncbi:ParB/RepB/Spo0J family partition protein [Papillibacter cinnamivorans]|uniref:Chromosome partitioning protein, ParB family n=1 Tax=Papillibacter cinnamivorans DSM 12816 TaxID=1122930 RepID=A0A1W2A8J7_9FIRM|nr:ParB/RepB/Spo0J family partition protein [Papillibacter cinnamivorans]SMC56974.1 chromosome partitioning protein, ParB family [Papillibacter cinnamivorans DSM 12816]